MNNILSVIAHFKQKSLLDICMFPPTFSLNNITPFLLCWVWVNWADR